jgi:hypothetical protein
MSVNFMGAPIFEGSDDLCTKAACPLAPGPIVIKYVQDLPPVAPPVRFRWFDLVCLLVVCLVYWEPRQR